MNIAGTDYSQPAELASSVIAAASTIFSMPAPLAKFCTPMRSARTVYLLLEVPPTELNP